MGTNSISRRVKATIIVIIVLISAIAVYAYLAKTNDGGKSVSVSMTSIHGMTISLSGTAILERKHLIVSTTTSLYETGFLDVLKTEFERRYPDINVSFISQGTGLAIQTAMRGDADMILVHDPGRELQFLQDGYGVNRKVIAYNFFVIVGPANDPAGIQELDPLNAMKQIRIHADAGLAVWLSRGDDSGTHAKEKRLWKAAGYNASELRKESWYLEAGSGMTATLKMADEKMAYTLTDLGTYLMNYNKDNIQLVKLVEAGEDLLNVYSVIACDPRNEYTNKANFEASMKFIKFVVSDEGQQLFDSFGKKDYGESLFKPYVKLLKTDSNSTVVKWIQKIAYFDGSECPPKYRYEEGDLYAMITVLSPMPMRLKIFSSS